MTQPDVLPGMLQADDTRAGRPGFTIHGNAAAVFEALAKAQAGFGELKRTRSVTVRSDKGTYTFAYAPLDAVLAAVTPALNAAGLSFCQPLVQEGDKWVLRTILAHESGAYIECSCSVPWPQKWNEKAGKFVAGGWQDFGSAVTYARRYVAGPLLGIAPEEDDDGNAAEDQPREVTQRQGPRQNTRATPPPTPAKAEPKKPEPAKTEAPADSGTWVEPPPTEAKKPSAPPPASGGLITPEQQKEIARLTTQGERLWPTQEPDGTFKTYKFTRATLDQLCLQVTKKTTVQISTADEAAALIAALNKLPESSPLQRKIWTDIRAKFGQDKESADKFTQAVTGRPASWVLSAEDAEKLAAALEAA